MWARERKTSSVNWKRGEGGKREIGWKELAASLLPCPHAAPRGEVRDQVPSGQNEDQKQKTHTYIHAGRRMHKLVKWPSFSVKIHRNRRMPPNSGSQTERKNGGKIQRSSGTI